MSRPTAILTSHILGGAALGTLVALPAGAAEMEIKLQLPEIQNTQYLRPYVAVWIEKADDTFVSTLSLWHMVKDKRGNPQTNGDRYLNTLRSWWKQSGTVSQMPIDGLSGATRSPGTHELAFKEGAAPLNTLASGKYQLVVEAVREVKTSRTANADGSLGPRMRGPSKDSLELVRVYFEWPARKATTVTAKGNTEIGNISLLLKP